MKIDAFYFERVCMNLGQLEYYAPLMHEFIEKLQDGDTVAFVGCGLQPDSVLALDKLCDKDIQILGIDPVLQVTESDSERIKLIPDTLERFLGIKSKNEYGSQQSMAMNAVNQNARLIAMYVCACEDAYDSKSLVLDAKLTAKNHMNDLKQYLKNNHYSVKPAGDSHFSILAEKEANLKDIEKPEGMSKEYYDALARHGHFD